MILFYFLITLMPLLWHPIWGKFVNEATLLKCVAAGCLFYGILHVAAQRKFPSALRSRQTLLFLALYGVVAVSHFSKRGVEGWEGPFMTFTSMLVLFFATLFLVDSEERVRRVLLVAIGSTAFAGLCVIREWQKYQDMSFGLRPGWAAGDANYFTVSSLVFLPLAFYWSLQRGPRWQRLFCFGCWAIIQFAVTLAASRGGFVGLCAAFLVLALRSRKRLQVLAVFGVLVLPLMLALPGSPIRRLMTPNVADEQSAQNRTALWGAGLRMFREHPWTGVGLANFKSMTRQYADEGVPEGIAHNSYLELAAEMGLPGLLTFVGLLYVSLRSLHHVRRDPRASSFLSHAASGMEAGLAGSVVSLVFISALNQKLLWLAIFLVMCLPGLVRRAAARQEESQEAPVRCAPDSLLRPYYQPRAAG